MSTGQRSEEEVESPDTGITVMPKPLTLVLGPELRLSRRIVFLLCTEPSL